MADVPTLLQPVEQALESGILMMPQDTLQAHAQIAASWGDNPVNAALTALCAITALIIFKPLLNILPHLLNCTYRWKACINLEDSMQLSRDRNYTALAFILPISLLCSRYHVFDYSFLENIPIAWVSIIIAGVLILFALLRRFIYLMLAFKAKRHETFRAAHCCSFSFFILLCILCLTAAGICSIAGASDSVTKALILYGSAFVYLINIVRKRQIFKSYCSSFTTFLYLCALEFLPTGMLVASSFLL